MSATKWLLGGLVAVGLVGAGAGHAAAQFVVPGGGFGRPLTPVYGGTFVTPSGGVVTKTAQYDPFLNTTVVNKTYVNPYTGYAAQRQYFAPGFGYGVPAYAPRLYQPGFVYPGYGGPGFGFPGYGIGYGSGFNIGYSRPGFSIGFSSFR